MDFDPQHLLNSVRGLPAAQCYWLGFSGGLDSTVLLHAMARLRGQLGGELRAIHVNHHLHPRSNAWQEHCRRVCAALEIPIECRDVTVAPAAGESLEAVARARRYEVYRELLRKSDLLLLAQHQDDQLETFLLQALRGAGLHGLAAMPVIAVLGRGQLARPLLGYTRAALQAWAQAEGLKWIEDPSNTDTHFDRNYLRQRVVPLLQARWPASAETVSRSARHCAEAMELLALQAADDLQQCTQSDPDSLALPPLLSLGVPRSRNVLRYWIKQLGLPLPPTNKLEQVFSEVLTARADRNPCVTWKGVELRRYRGRLYVMRPLSELPAEEYRLGQGVELDLGGSAGVLSLQTARAEGLRLAMCPEEGFRVRFRSGGEICRPAGRAHRRPLKKWLQDYGVLPWMRARLPLIYAGGELAAVAGLFVCAPFAAGEAESGLRIHWRNHPRLLE